MNRYLHAVRLPEYGPAHRLPTYLGNVDRMADMSRKAGGHPYWSKALRLPWPYASGRPLLSERAAQRQLFGNAQNAHTSRRISWTLGVQLPTVEDLAPVATVEVTTALRDPARVDIVPSRPDDLNQIPPTALPRSGDPAPVANRRGVCGLHTARTSHGGAPPT